MTTPASDTAVLAPEPPPAPAAAPPIPAAVPAEPEVIAAADPTTPAVEAAEPAVEPAPDAPTDAEPVDEKWVHTGEWTYDWLDYHGDLLAIRIPHQNALTGMFQAQACSEGFQVQLMQKFVKRHISRESLERVIERMSDPDDEQYLAVEGGVWNDLLKTISDIGGDRALKDAEALAAVKNGKGK